MTTSRLYRAEMAFIRRLGHMNVFSLDEEALRRWLERYGTRQPRGVPPFILARHRVTRQTVAGCPCPSIEPRRGWQEGSPLVLFLHGGGFIFEALPMHWMAASKIVRRSGTRVIFPSYPLLPRAGIYEANDMVLELYRQLCARYGHSTITVLGDSAGATLALTLTLSILRHEPTLKVPKQLILVSPAQGIMDDPSLRARVQAQGATDVMIPPSLLYVLQRLMPQDASRDRFFATPLEQDYTGFPPTEVYCGSAEVFYPFMEGFISRLHAAGVTANFHVGEGMCHVWPYVPLAPEATQALDRIIATITR
ncbi:MAG: alpha/beta hydrolase [Coriobacteriales bacterium]|nr:alpha/beta hydrolase [Coriobacteriales bacterium]